MRVPVALVAVGVSAMLALTACSTVTLPDTVSGSTVEDSSLTEKEVETIAGRGIEFYGQHMPGIEENIQMSTRIIVLDIKDSTDKDAMLRWMRLLTSDIASMSKGEAVLGHPSPGLEKGPSGFSAYVGFGVSLFEKLGLEDQMPASFRVLPEFKGEALEEQYTGGDVLIHVAADDPIVLSQRSRLLIRNSVPFATVRSVQEGFANTPDPNAEKGGIEHRNLFGQIDGTVNPELLSDDFDDIVWLDEEAPDWAEDGTILVIRRIAMIMEPWDSLSTVEKEESIGRDLSEGELLEEIPADSHVALAQPQEAGERIFRRPFSYEEDPAPNGKADVGLLFLSYQTDLDKQFIPILTRLSESDRLNAWIRHVGSSEWVIPGGVAEGEIIAEDLFS